MSRSPALFELMRRIAEDHGRRAEENRLTVVPVIVDDLPAVLPVLRGAAAYLDGTLLDATGADLDAAVDGDDDPKLRATASESLIIQRPSGDTQVEIVPFPQGRVDARFRGRASVTSKGERQVLAIARALFSARARSASFAILAYDEAGMDGPSRRVCWRYTAVDLARLRLGRLRTLVVIVGIDAVDDNRHCAPGRGFHFALLDGRLVRRRTDDSVAAAVAHITASAAAHTVLFLGAGASASSGLPLGNSLRDDTIRRLIGTATSESLRLAREFRIFLGNHEHLLTAAERDLTIDQFTVALTLEQVIRAEKALRPGAPKTLDVFADRNKRALAASGGPGAAPRAIQRMAAAGGRRLVVIEVNFDTLVEHGHEHLFRRFTTDDEFKSAKSYLEAYLRGGEHRVPLLKLHGSIEDRESCVASVEQTANGLPDVKAEPLMRSATAAPGEKVPWVYVGASMRDLDLAEVFNRREFAVGVHEYWVAPYLPPTVRSFAETRRQHIWTPGEDVHAHSVTELADEFLSKLAAAWT
jgi:hypothetical protein